MHNLLVHIHIFANAVFSLMAIILCYKSLLGYINGSSYSKTQVYIENGYLGLLYFGLLMGIILYFFYRQPDNLSEINLQELQKQQISRFWAIEHFSVMVFALMISQVGKIFTSKSISHREKYKYALFYYGVATMIILISMSIYLYFKFR